MAATHEKNPCVSVTVAPLTGGPFVLKLDPNASVEELKRAVAKRLKVLRERICLLHKERQLNDGSLWSNGVGDGSRITLLPRAETGLLAQKPEQSVMQALESLSDAQVVDFLSGKAPLNLTMRLGDHMMLIQLQLSTVNASQPAAKRMKLNNGKPRLDTKALAEASKNLTQTLKQLSSEVLVSKTANQAHSSPNSNPNSPQNAKTSRKEPMNNDKDQKRGGEIPAAAGNSAGPANARWRKRGQPSTYSGSGAIIESMHHHGKGVYSGTFSGTLNPALQDKNGQPKRDITTIIHILNDLLCAQYKNYHRPNNNNGSNANVATKNETTNAATASSSSQISPETIESKASCSPRCASSATPAPASSAPAPAPLTAAEQLEVTRWKVLELRRIMEERRALRRAKRASRATNFATSWSLTAKKTDTDTGAGAGTGTLDFAAEPVTV